MNWFSSVGGGDVSVGLSSVGVVVGRLIVIVDVGVERTESASDWQAGTMSNNPVRRILFGNIIPTFLWDGYLYYREKECSGSIFRKLTQGCIGCTIGLISPKVAEYARSCIFLSGWA